MGEEIRPSLGQFSPWDQEGFVYNRQERASVTHHISYLEGDRIVPPRLYSAYKGWGRTREAVRKQLGRLYSEVQHLDRGAFGRTMKEFGPSRNKTEVIGHTDSYRLQLRYFGHQPPGYDEDWIISSVGQHYYDTSESRTCVGTGQSVPLDEKHIRVLLRDPPGENHLGGFVELVFVDCDAVREWLGVIDGPFTMACGRCSFNRTGEDEFTLRNRFRDHERETGHPRVEANVQRAGVTLNQQFWP